MYYWWYSEGNSLCWFRAGKCPICCVGSVSNFILSVTFCNDVGLLIRFAKLQPIIYFARCEPESWIIAVWRVGFGVHFSVLLLETAAWVHMWPRLAFLSWNRWGRLEWALEWPIDLSIWLIQCDFRASWLSFSTMKWQWLSIHPTAAFCWTNDGNLVDSASGHALVSKIKPCMSKHKSLALKLRTAHCVSCSLFDSPLLLGWPQQF